MSDANNNPFSYVMAVTSTKQNLMVDDLTEKGYNAFLTNRALSYHYDTVLIANEMNKNHHIDKKLQFDFFLKIIRKGKRYSKWIKPEKLEAIDLIKERYNYSDEKARQVLPLFSSEQIKELKESLIKGGKTNK